MSENTVIEAFEKAIVKLNNAEIPTHTVPVEAYEVRNGYRCWGCGAGWIDKEKKHMHKRCPFCWKELVYKKRKKKEVV